MHRQDERRGSRLLRVWSLRIAALSLLLLAVPALTGCEDEVVVSQPPPPKGPNERAAPPSGAGQVRSKDAAGGAVAQARVEQGGASWLPNRGGRRVEQGRDPFYGFVDELIAERARLEAEARAASEIEEEPLKPAQRFDVRDFHLVAIITNTAQPKALLIDPLGIAHRLRTGDLIGKKNGVIVDIRRNEIEILQGENLLEGERVLMRLHPELAPGVHVELQ